MYRLRLKPNNCSLLIEKFNPQSNGYSYYSDCMPVNYTGKSCSYLTIKNGTLYTDNQDLYSKLPGDNYAESALLIDDLGMVRL